MRYKNYLYLLIALFLLVTPMKIASGAPVDEETIMGIDTIWVLLAAFLVFFMQAGFGMVEAGFIRAKNSINILMKNFVDYCLASVMFFIVGYAIMFGDGNGIFGHTGFFLRDAVNNSGVPLYAFVLFCRTFFVW